MQSSQQKLKLTAETRLADLQLPHLAVILDEVFLLPPAAFGAHHQAEVATLADLSVASQLSLDEVRRRLQEVRAWCTSDLELSAPQLASLLAQGEELVLLDVRPAWEFHRAHIPGSVLIEQLDFPSFLAGVQEAGTRVVTVCHHGVRSFSAALYLKQQGLQRVSSLAGGVDAWALAVDPKIGRY